VSWSQALIRFFADAFRPPFRTTHWVVMIYVALSIIYNSDSHFNRWTFPDTDDYMRLTQMLNWVIGGQSWFDLRMPHLYPDHVISMHWSRLPDLPLAGTFLLLQSLAHFFQWETTPQNLGILTAFFVPFLLLAGLLYLMRLCARPLLTKRLAGTICFLVVLCGQLIFQFLPMRVDHHAYVILSAGAAFFCLQMMAIHLHPVRMAAAASIALALAMWNGAEILPMLVLFCAALTLLSILDRRIMRATALFGAFFFAACLILLFVARAPGNYWAIEYDAFSFFYVLLAMMVAAFFLSLFAAECFIRNRWILTAYALFTALCGMALLLNYFPDFVYGPYAQTNPLLDTIFFPNIREAIPLFKAWADIGNSFSNAPNQSISGGLYYTATRMFIIVLGTATAIAMAIRSPLGTRRQKLWALYAFFGTGFGMLAMFWQVRVISYAQLFSIVPLAWLMLTYLKRLPQHYQGRKLFAYEILTVFGLTIFPMIIVPAIINKTKFMPDMMFFLGKGVDSPCNDRSQVVAYLDDLAKREKKTATILSTLDYTPDLMFYTPHNFIAAPYHRNDRGIIDMAMFFRSRPDDVSARTIAKKLKLDYVLVCKSSYFQGTLNRNPEIRTIRATINAKDNKVELKPDPKELAKASLGMRLANDIVPSWLEQRDIPLEGNFLLFEVKKNKLGNVPKR
jgi:hypothetical protein